MKKTKALLFDMVMCGGCRRCVVACKESHGFPLPEDPADIKVLTRDTYTAMTEVEEYPLRHLCRHCNKPSCASVCPVGALQKTDLGPVTYDASRCIGCRYCLVACPFSIPRYDWDKAVPAVHKCDMCFDRITSGKIPACAEACPHEATVFGDRDELLALARKRIAEEPDEYLDHIYGEHEAGGTSVLFLAPKRIAALGFDKLGDEPLPALTWKALSKVPAVAVCGGAALAAFWWIMRRRDEVSAYERKEQGHGV